MMLDLVEREKRYQTMMVITRRMLQERIINKKDFVKLEKHFYEKYQPLLRVKIT